MKDFAPHILFGIAQEVFGLWLYVGILAGVGLLALYLYLVLQRASFGGLPRRLALVVGLIGAGVAVVLAPVTTQATFAHFTAWIDWVALALVALGGFVVGFLASLPFLVALVGERRHARRAAITRRTATS
ncbi:DUF5368 family protein [Salinarimonas sp.]|uniref:DUF5368 family protein n=1 Tax=Salinarimonas sp. TaxID=2766526 RepID=UPI00391B3BD4